jgi:hypothetical protein
MNKGPDRQNIVFLKAALARTMNARWRGAELKLNLFL